MDSSRLVLIVVTVLSALLCSSIVGLHFLSDDYVLLECLSEEGLSACRAGAREYFRPLSMLSLWAQLETHGPQASLFRLFNCYLHLACALVSVVIARRVLHSELAAMAVGASFLVLASHMEVLAWIACRPDLLATLFALLGIAFALYERPYLALLALTIALGAKESALSLFLIIGLFNRNILLPGMALTSGYLVLRWLVLGSWFAGAGTLGSASLWGINLVKTLPRVFLPPMPPTLLYWLLIIVCWLALCSAVIRERLRCPWLISVGGAWFLSLLPVLNRPISSWDSQNERLLYLPSVFALILFWGLVKQFIARRQRFGQAVLAFVLVQGLLCWYARSPWCEASRLTESIIATLSLARDSSQLCVLNLPDNFRGAYVFRNGFAAALRRTYGRAMPETIWVLSSNDLFRVDDPIPLEIQGQRFRLGSAAKATVFRPRPAAMAAKDFLTIHEHSRYRLDMELHADLAGCPVFAYSAGRMRQCRVVERSAVIILDLQRDFIGENARYPADATSVERLLEKVNMVVEQAKALEVVYVATVFPKSQWLRNFVRRYAAVEGTSGLALDERLQRRGDALYWKSQGNALCNHLLDQYLRRHGIQHVVIAGVFADKCVLATARGARNRGYRVTVLRDGVAAASMAARRAALQKMENEGFQLITAAELITSYR